jgi:hypothetical protein
VTPGCALFGGGTKVSPVPLVRLPPRRSLVPLDPVPVGSLVLGLLGPGWAGGVPGFEGAGALGVPPAGGVPGEVPGVACAKSAALVISAVISIFMR